MANSFIAFLIACILRSFFSNTCIAQIDRNVSSDAIADFTDIPEIHWKFLTNAPIFASPVVNENLVYIGGVDSILFAIDIQTGIEKWRFRTNGEIRSNVCVADHRLYLNGGDGNLYALNKKSGNLLWTYHSEGERKYDFADYFHSSPVLKNGIVYFGSGDGNLSCFPRYGTQKYLNLTRMSQVNS